MNAIKRGFKLLGTKSPFEKEIVKLLCSPDHSAPTEKMIERMLVAIKDADANPLAKSNIKVYFDHLKNTKNWEDAAKLLITAHQALYDEAAAFGQEFATSTMQNVLDLPNNKEEFKLYVRCGLIKYYYRYLKKLAESYYSLYKCRRYTTTDFSAILSKNDSQIITQFTQLKENVTFLAKVEDFFVSSVELQTIPIIQMIGELMLRDCIEFYNLLSIFVTNTIKTIFELPDDMALMLDAVYSDLLRLHKPMVAFFELRRSFLGKIAKKEPLYYVLNLEFNKKEELHINKVRKRHKEKLKMQSQFLVTLPDRPADHFEFGSENQNHDPDDSERKEDDHTGSGIKSSKITTDRKVNFESEMLLTSEDKDYFDDGTYNVEEKTQKSLKSLTSLSSVLSPKQINLGPRKVIHFTKIPKA